MKADDKKMFPAPLNNIRVNDAIPFPLYIFLQKNNRYIPIRKEGDTVDEVIISNFMKHKMEEIWIPNHFQEKYLEYIGKLGSQTGIGATVIANNLENADQIKVIPKSEEAELVADVFNDEELPQEEKTAILAAVSQDLLRSLNKITNKSPEARKEGIEKCDEIANEILKVAGQNSNIY